MKIIDNLTVSEWEVEAEKVYNFVTEMYPHEDMYPTMHFSSGHIVWEDGNFESHFIQWCLDNVSDKDRSTHSECIDWLIWSLKGLLLLPKYEDCLDYEDTNNEDN